ncbi:MAG: DUF3298 and DUF4163 domain-containing protein [Clostridia bacterium]|nr:DUF3298 and DUF4163 domain-containing protein [Clostridia bacterium]
MKCEFIKKQTIKDKLYHNKVLMVDVKIDYPSITQGYEGDPMRFNMHYRQKAQKNYRYASTKLYQAAVKQYTIAKPQGVPFNNFEFVEAFEPTYCRKPFISLYYDLYEFTGGAHGNTIRKGNTWDMRRGVMLPLEAFFDKDYDYQAVMLRYIESEARRRQITGMATYFDGLHENLKKYFDAQNYYLTEEGLAIFYPLYTIAPYVDGIQVFIIPYLIFGDKIKYKL